MWHLGLLILALQLLPRGLGLLGSDKNEHGMMKYVSEEKQDSPGGSHWGRSGSRSVRCYGLNVGVPLKFLC